MISTGWFVGVVLVFAQASPAHGQPAEQEPSPEDPTEAEPEHPVAAEPPPVTSSPPQPPEVQRFDDVATEPATPPVPGARPADSVPLTQMDEISVPTARSRITLNMFGNLSLEQTNSNHHLDFHLGGLGLLMIGRASPELEMVSEVVVESDDGETIIDLERMFLQWKNRRYEVGAGRTHTDLGYWSPAFHHGKWLQLTVDRPRAVRFEDDGGLLPIHNIGVWVTARTPIAHGTGRATVMIANGRGRIVDDVRSSSDLNLAKAIIVHLGLEDVGITGLRYGVSGSYDRIAPQPIDARPALADTPIDEVIANAYVAHRGSHWTVISELYDIIHRGGKATQSTFAGFAVVGYKIAHLVPFVMAEARTTSGGNDPFFVPDSMSPRVTKFVEGTAGMRYELNTWSALKFQLQVMRSQGRTSELGIVDWSIGL